MKILSGILLLFFTLLLIYAVSELPCRGGTDSPTNRDSSVVGTPTASTYYIRNAESETATPNIVTAILADYRGYDTLGETVVIFAACIVVFLLLRLERENAS